MLLLWTIVAVASAPVVNAAPVAGSTSEEGFVTAKLDINEAGTVDKCTVVATNASQDFSEKVCGILASKAKFEPKRDDKGAAQKNSVTQTIRFKLQD